MEISDRNLTLLLFVIGTVITLLVGFKDEIRDRYRTWDKASLEKIINKLKNPEYVQRQKYLRDRSAIIGFAVLAGLMAIQGIIFSIILNALSSGGKSGRISGAAQFQFGVGYVAFMFFLNAYDHHKHANRDKIKRRLENLTNTYRRYLQP